MKNFFWNLNFISQDRVSVVSLLFDVLREPYFKITPSFLVFHKPEVISLFALSSSSTNGAYGLLSRWQNLGLFSLASLHGKPLCLQFAKWPIWKEPVSMARTYLERDSLLPQQEVWRWSSLKTVWLTGTVCILLRQGANRLQRWLASSRRREGSSLPQASSKERETCARSPWQTLHWLPCASGHSEQGEEHMPHINQAQWVWSASLEAKGCRWRWTENKISLLLGGG